jgi:hypothetical protein
MPFGGQSFDFGIRHIIGTTSKSTQPYQRERASITGVGLNLRESM